MKLKNILLYLTVFLLSLNTVSFAEEIKDIKPPVCFKSNYTFLFIVGVIIFAAGLIWWAKFFLKTKKLRADSSVFTTPAHEIAYGALEKLKAKNLAAAGKIKEYYFELSYIVRNYIENRFGIRSSEMTTEEFLLSLRDFEVLNGTDKNLLKKFLNLSDIVKFAKYNATQKEADESFALAKNFIDETKKIEESGKV